MTVFCERGGGKKKVPPKHYCSAPVEDPQSDSCISYQVWIDLGVKIWGSRIKVKISAINLNYISRNAMSKTVLKRIRERLHFSGVTIMSGKIGSVGIVTVNWPDAALLRTVRICLYVHDCCHDSLY